VAPQAPQPLVLNLDEFGGILGLGPGASDHNGHRLTHIAHPITRQGKLWRVTQERVQTRCQRRGW
jgi:hypothetical protein